VVKPDWGKKLTCPSCGAKFYNMNKDPATCPKCETKVEAQPILKPRRQPVEAVKPKPKKVAVVADEIEDDDDPLLDDDDEDIDIDDDDGLEELTEKIKENGPYKQKDLDEDEIQVLEDLELTSLIKKPTTSTKKGKLKKKKSK